MITEVSDKDLALIESWQADWGKFAVEALGVELDPDQEEILYSVQFNPRTAVRSGHARGKDFISAVACMCFHYLIVPSKVICTAPTGRQVKNIQLAEMKRLWRNANIPLGGRVLNDSIRSDFEDWFILGFKAGDTKPEDWTGFHSPNILVCVTEASGIEQQTFDALEGLLTGNSRYLIVTNPNKTSGESYNAFRSPQYRKFKLSCLNAPNVLAKKVLIPGQVDWNWIDTMVKKPGWATPVTLGSKLDPLDFEWEGQWYTPSNLFRVKVMGEFPTEGEDQLIPLTWVEAANARWIERGGKIIESDKVQDRRIGADIAGMGNDLTVFTERTGSTLTAVKTYSKSDHMQTVGRLREALGQNGVGYIDTIGEGAGVFSRCEELQMKVVSCKYSKACKGLTDVTGQRKFRNMRAFCYWALRDALNPEYGLNLAIPPIDELTQDLTEPTYEVNSQGLITIEAKDDIKKRIGRSPDYGDALSMTFWPYGVRTQGATDIFRGIGIFG